MSVRKLWGGLLLLSLMVSVGCAAKPSPGSSLLKMTKAFSERMRWADFDVASAYVVEEEREAFLANWKVGKDLHVVETRVDRIKMIDEETAEVAMTVDYYLLPSATVKQVESQQEWHYNPGQRFQFGSWELVSGVPMLPDRPHLPQKDE